MFLNSDFSEYLFERLFSYSANETVKHGLCASGGQPRRPGEACSIIDRRVQVRGRHCRSAHLDMIRAGLKIASALMTVERP